MRIVLLRRKRFAISVCRGMKKSLSETFERDVQVIPDSQKGLYPPTADILIRWGTRKSYPSNITINEPEMIKRINDKILSRTLLQEEGISIPKTYYNKEDILYTEDTPISYPLIGRERFHSQGKNMIISHNKQDVMRDYTSEYWSSFIKKDKEFRVYIFFNKVLAVSEKIPGFPNRISWNNSRSNGIFQNIGWKRWNLDVCNEAIKASNLFHMDFCAIDVILKDGTPYILELNSAPSISDYRQELFSRGFDWVIDFYNENDTKPEHFDVIEPSPTRYQKIIFPSLLNK